MKNYRNADEKYIKNVKMFVKDNDSSNVLYHDREYKEPVSKEEVRNLIDLNIQVEKGTTSKVIFIPVQIENDGGKLHAFDMRGSSPSKITFTVE